MKIVFSALVASMSGSLGGSSIRKSRYGYVLENKPMPTKSISQKQSFIRQSKKMFGQAWLNMSEAERVQWNDLAKYLPTVGKRDESKQLTGYSLFFKFQSYWFTGRNSLYLVKDYKEKYYNPSILNVQWEGEAEVEVELEINDMSVVSSKRVSVIGLKDLYSPVFLKNKSSMYFENNSENYSVLYLDLPQSLYKANNYFVFVLEIMYLDGQIYTVMSEPLKKSLL